MWLTGKEIEKQVKKGNIEISPFNPSFLNSNSYNYSLGPNLKRIKNKIIDLKTPDTYEDLVIPPEGLILYPGECYLGSTTEVFCSTVFAALVTGRSSIGRKFITNHVTAGLIDQGFRGQITLEIVVFKPTRVYPQVPFGQIFWFKTIGEALLYQGKYQSQMGPTGSLVHKDLKKKRNKKD